MLSPLAVKAIPFRIKMDNDLKNIAAPGPRVLIIDDNRTTSAMLADILRENGYEPKTAGDGAEGLKVVSEWNPSVVLLDLVIPGMSGIEVCKKIRGSEPKARPSIIVVSLKDDKDTVVNALKNGADDFIIKPVHDAELVARVKAQTRIAEFYKGVEDDRQNLERILDITNVIAATLDANEILNVIVSKVAEVTSAIRCSIVLIAGEDEAYVLASHDDPAIRDFRLDLAKYPEIQEAVLTKKVLAIEDMTNHPLFGKVKDRIKDFAGMSVLIAPIVFNDDVLGTIFLRTNRKGGFSKRELDFLKIVANSAFHAIKNARLFEKISREKDRLGELAIKDHLTALYNHNFFYTKLEEEFERAVRYDLPLSLIMMDIDDFKNINDIYGHRVGDNVLKDLAAMIRRGGRKTDTVARYGGEEFAVILPHTGLKGAIEEAERLRLLIEGHTYAGLMKNRITVSLGVASYPHSGVINSGDLVNHADNALYKAKWAGKNRVHVDDGEDV